jgi:PAS domain S-box-containing protein
MGLVESQRHARRWRSLVEEDRGTGIAHLGVVDGLCIAAVTCDLDGLITGWNGEAVRLFGDAAQLRIGASLASGSILCDTEARRMLGAVLKHGCWRGEIHIRVGEGSVLADVRATTIAGSEGVCRAVLLSVVDVTPSVTADRDQWHTIVDSLASGVALLDGNSTIVAVNEAWRRSGRDAGASSDYVGRNYIEVCEGSGELTALEAGAGLRRLANGESDLFELVYPCDRPEGREWYLMRAVPYAGGDGGWTVVSHQDVTEARLDHERVVIQREVLNQIDAAVHITDVEGTVLTWNAAAERLFGWTAAQAMGSQADDLGLVPVVIDPETRGAIRAGRWDGELLLGRKDGSTFPALVRTSVSNDADGGLDRITCVVIDISDGVQSQRELKAARDHLRAVTDSIGEGMFTLDRDGRVTYVNPAAERVLGWRGEELQGRMIQEFLRPDHASWSGTGVDEAPAARDRGDGEVIRVDDDMFSRADGTTLPVEYTTARFATDHGTGGSVVVFRDISERKAQSQRLERELANLTSYRRIQEAVAEDRFVLFAQPIIDLVSGEVVQRELLIRMTDPDDPTAIIAPGEFLPVAEQYGLIGEIDRWVIDRSAEIAATGLAVELNISAASIGDPQLLPYIENAIRRSGADPQNMVFEITETTLVAQEAAGREFVERLHEIGSKVALDDFGTGYGGFTYLKQLPIDYLKIDIEFVRDLPNNNKSRHVVEAIVTLADRFDLKTVAEGVEDELTLQMVRELGVSYAQGYGIGRPAPLPDRLTAEQSEVS